MEVIRLHCFLQRKGDKCYIRAPNFGGVHLWHPAPYRSRWQLVDVEYIAEVTHENDCKTLRMLDDSASSDAYIGVGFYDMELPIVLTMEKASGRIKGAEIYDLWKELPDEWQRIWS